MTDVNEVLYWLVLVNCGIPLVASLVPSRRIGRAWRVKLVLIMVATQAVSQLGWGNAGFVGLGLLTVLVLAPQAAYRATARLLGQKRHRLAGWTAWLAQRLHPYGSMHQTLALHALDEALQADDPAKLHAMLWELPEEMHGVANAQCMTQLIVRQRWGHMMAASKALAQGFEQPTAARALVASGQGDAAEIAAARLLALQATFVYAPLGGPEGAADGLDEMGRLEVLCGGSLADPLPVEAMVAALLPHGSATLLPYARALAETGHVADLIAVWRLAAATPTDDPFLLDMLRLYVLGFSGQIEATRAAVSALNGIDPGLIQVWTAIAMQSAGAHQQAATTLQPLLDAKSPTVRSSAAYRLAQPLPPVAELSEADQALLGTLVRETLTETRHAAAGRFSRLTPVTAALVAVNVMVFLAMTLQGGSTQTEVLVRFGALRIFIHTFLEMSGGVPLPGMFTWSEGWQHMGTLINGQWWRVFTANFLHLGATHLVMNMLGLWLFGVWLEQRLGKVRFLVLYLATGLFAMAGVLFLTSVGAIEVGLIVGASGSVMGLVGGTMAVLLLGWQREGAKSARARFGLVFSVVIVQAIFDSMSVYTSSEAHLGGALCGFVLGLLLARSEPLVAAAPASATAARPAPKAKAASTEASRADSTADVASRPHAS